MHNKFWEELQMSDWKQVDNILLKNVIINDQFWIKFLDLVRQKVIPYQWDAINDQIPGAAKSHAVKNLKLAAKKQQGDFHGHVFQDTDVYKWLECTAYSLTSHPNPQLETLADSVIEVIAKAQHADGYLNSYFTLVKPKLRWRNLRDRHELYCAGHLFEAAVAYFQATGKAKIIDIACKFADYINQIFGNKPDQIPGYPGHEEIELALVKLYQTTKNEKYLRLSKYFIDQRGTQPHYFSIEAKKRQEQPSSDYRYHQAHLPVKEQVTAEGHAVRAMYLYAGAADIAYYTQDKELKDACFRIWKNVINRRMYITGGIGSSAHGESFTFDYDLPNSTAYAETCASIGLVFFAYRMFKLNQSSEFGDIIERILYNGALSAMSLDGKSFFYVNPLEVWPTACEQRHDHRHVKTTRQPWFGCACCPPNLARLITSLGEYIYTVVDNSQLYVNLYIGGTAAIDIAGENVEIIQQSTFPWDGKVKLTFNTPDLEFTLALRIPNWSNNTSVNLNGKTITTQDFIRNGFVKIHRTWSTNDTIEIEFPMKVVKITANPQVRENRGKVAIMRGPLVYCLEQVDNGSQLHNLIIDQDSTFSVEHKPDLLNGISVITVSGKREIDDWNDVLYKANSPLTRQSAKLTFIPYYAWANRKQGEMLVWIRIN